MKVMIMMLLMLTMMVGLGKCWTTTADFNGTLECPHPKFCAIIYYREDDYGAGDEDAGFVGLHCTLGHVLTHNTTVVYSGGDGITNVYEPYIDVFHDCQHPLVKSRFALDEIFVDDHYDFVEYNVRLPLQTQLADTKNTSHSKSFSVKDIIRAPDFKKGTFEDRQIIHQWYKNGVVPPQFYPALTEEELKEQKTAWCTKEYGSTHWWMVLECLELK